MSEEKQIFTEDQTNSFEVLEATVTTEMMSVDVTNNIQKISPSGFQLKLDVELPAGSDSVAENSLDTLLPLELHSDAINSQDRSKTESEIQENIKITNEASLENKESTCDFLIDFLDDPVKMNISGDSKIEAPMTCLLTGILDQDIPITNEVAYNDLQTSESGNGIDELDAFIKSIYDVFPEASDSNIEILGDTESTVFEAIITKDDEKAESANETKRLSIGFFDLKIIEDMTPDGVNNLVKSIYEVLPKKLNETETAKTETLPLKENLYDTLPAGIRLVNDLSVLSSSLDNTYIQVVEDKTDEAKILNSDVESDYSTLKYGDAKCIQYEATAFGKSTIYRPMCHHYETIKEWKNGKSCLRTKKSTAERKKRAVDSNYEDVVINRPKKGVTFNEVVEVKEYVVTTIEDPMETDPKIDEPEMTTFNMMEPKMMDPKMPNPKRPKKKLVRKVFGRLLKK